MSDHINIENWLALYHSPKVGVTTFHNYLLEDPYLTTLPKNITPDWHSVKKDLLWQQQNTHAHILTIIDDRYPTLLKNISNPPPILYVMGDINCLTQPQIAIVGTRHPSTMGMQHAEYFAQQLVKCDFVITSGLALGIDGAAHRGALSVGGKTIAVLAHGMDTVYPACHKNLAEQIETQGCLVSEFSMGTRAAPGCFPRRNRIISGLSMGILVVEAALKSGSLITASFAGDHGREVFAIPGAINNPKVAGCHQLIRQGAKLVESAKDIQEELASLLNCVIRDKNASNNMSLQPNVSLTARQQQCLDFIAYDSTGVDLIAARTGVAISMVSAILLELELQGLITAVPGGYARKLS
jgi:DNA processing protein